MRGLVVGVALLGACIESSLVPCGDLACPVGTACDVSHASCVAPGQLTACDGKAELADCEAPPLTGGCFDGVCLPRGCGNGIVEPTEMCDDGNQLSNDGCRSDCLSDERCGNEITDTGETCDDGNARSHDGCDSRCLVETAAWRVTTLAPVGPTDDSAFDVARNVLVVSAGPRFWEYSAGQWRRHEAPRAIDAMYYDAQTARTVLLAGDAMFTWDGTLLVEVAAPNGPAHPSIATYDLVGRRAWVIGASDNASRTLWSFDATGWHSTSIAFGLVGPVAFGFDPLTERPAMLATSTDGITRDWQFTGTTWLTTATSIAQPPGDTALIQHAQRNRLLVREARGLAERRPGGWILVDAAAGPGDLLSPIAYDVVLGRLLVVDRDASVSAWTAAWARLPGKVPARPAGIAALPGGEGIVLADTRQRELFATSSTAVALASLPTAGLPATQPFTLVASPTRLLAVSTLDPGDGPIMLTTSAYESGTWTPIATQFSAGMRTPSFVFEPQRGQLLAFDREGDAYAFGPAGWVREPSVPSHVLSTVAWDAGLGLLVAITAAGQVADLTPAGWRDTLSLSSGYRIVADPQRASVVFLPVDAAQPRVWERRQGNWAETTPLPEGLASAAVTSDPRTGALVVAGTTPTEARLLVHRWTSATPDETCGMADEDGDGLTGCADDDCWWTCTPACPPLTSCP